MAAPTPTMSFPPYAYAPRDDDSYVVKSVTDAERNLTSGQTDLSKDIHQTTLGLRDAIEKGTYLSSNSIERTAGQTLSAVERTGAGAVGTSERVGGQLMGSVERNGGTIMTAIEKVAGENRLTTTITSAANRQAAADTARDIAIAVERNGANSVNATQNANTTLLGSIERNAGEGRVTTVTSQAALDAKLTDVRHSILNDVNRTGAEMVGSNIQNLNVLTKHVTDGAWETRQAIGNGFSNVGLSIVKGHAEIQKANADYYASMLLEQQKLGQFMTSKMDNQFAATQMEVMKCKSDLSAQSAQQFSIGQLEQQKLGAMISAQMAEAKYDSLKNNNDLSKQLAECCCELKEKNDTLDRERLRDNLNTANNDNNFLKVLEHTRSHGPGYGYGILGGPGYGGYGGPGIGAHVGPYGNHDGYGNVNVYSDRQHRSRRRSRSRSRSRSP